VAPGFGRPAGGRGLKIDARRVVARRQAERRALVGRAERFAAALGADPNVLAVVVFGSVARGDFNLWSDVDVLVVLGEVDDRRVEQVRAAGREVGPVQPVVWTAAQLRAQRRRHDPIAIESVEHGIWLVGDAADLPGA
jgi:uncharacterized protein